MPLSQGQILHDRYRIVRPLGQGGFGAVYRAWDLTLDRPCAVKESFELSPQGQRQFVFEARILGRLSHPNLPRVTDYFTLPGQGQYLVMDYVEGHDLEELRAQAGGRLPEAQVLPWIAQVCEALEYLHSQQPAVIHRDIKPANIKITPPDRLHPGGRAMLVDFGVAKVYDPAMRTTMGARAVTPGYSPHEQYGQSSAATDARTDIYALGATLYSLLTGQDPPESILRMVSDPLLLPRRLAPAISPAVEAVILKAMQMDPGRRFQSAAEFSYQLSVNSDQLSGGGGQLSVSSGQLSVGGGQLSVSSDQLSVGGRGLPVVTQPPGGQRGAAPAAAGVPLSPATMGMPLPRPARTFPWKWVVIGAGVVVGLVLLAVVAGLALKGAADSRAAQTTQVSPVDGMVLSYIPAGTFLMGSNDGYSDEQPVHNVTLDAFWMDQTEVTNAMYALCVAAGDCSPPHGSLSSSRDSYYGYAAYADYPVIEVDWSQGQSYCTWAGRRLPTEAQWEYAARGGLVGATYPWGNEAPSCTLGAANGAQYSDCTPDDTIAVGSFAPNGYGLYDMAGNVWEWVADWYGSYSHAAVDNPSGPASLYKRVLRGGAWSPFESSLRVSDRFMYAPDYSYNYSIGFRCARSP